MNLLNVKLFHYRASQGEKIVTILWYFIWGIAFFGELLSAFSLRIPFLDSTSYIANYIVIISLVLMALPYITRKIKKVDIFCWFLYCFYFFISYLLYLQNNQIQEEYAAITMLFTYPYLFLGLNIDIENMRKPMARISLIVIIWYAFYCMIYQQNKIGSMADNEVREGMHFAYLVLPHLLMCMWTSFKDKDILSIMGTCLGVFLLLSLGNRGSLVDVVLYILAYILLFVKSRRKYLIYALAIIIIGFVFFYMDVVILFFQRVLSELGMSTRIFDFLADNSFVIGNSVDEREFFREKLMVAIKDSPLLGYGFCGSWQFIGSYPHNLFYDLTITFGPFLGLLILFMLAILIVKAYRAATNSDERAFLLILIITGFVKLFISYTFLNNVETFLMIGYCLLLIRNRRKQKVIC